MRQPKNRKMFLRHLQDNYGKQIRKDLNRLAKDLDVSLTWLGDKYCFTREYARQLFFKYHGYKYTRIKREKGEIIKRRTKQIKKESFYLSFDPTKKLARFKKGSSNIYKGVIAEAKAKELCSKLKYKITIDPKKSVREIDLIINDYFCEVKSSYTPFYPNKNASYGYFHADLSKKQREKANFVLFYVAPWDTFYVIPLVSIPSRSVFIPEINIPHRYDNYKEAWGLLNLRRN